MTLLKPLNTAQAEAVKTANAVLKAAHGYHTVAAKPAVSLCELSAVEEMYSYYGADRA